MPRIHRTPSLLLAVATLSLMAGCTWVHMAPGASAVRVVSAGTAPAGCQKLGEISVSVKDNVAFYDRNELRVREELETLARNEAPGLGADTIQPLGHPDDGSQRFAGFRCNGSTAAPSAGTITHPISG